jgi:hypothetical protein
MNSSEIASQLRDPSDGTGLIELSNEFAIFRGGNRYPVYEGKPILIDETRSLFSIADVLKREPTTQSQRYRDVRIFKNRVRQRILPSLTSDRRQMDRYHQLGSRIKGGRVLVVGTGDKAKYCRKIFEASEVTLSDIHCQFDVDFVFDAHSIPFQDASFSLVLLPQVLEHTCRPWQVAEELMRVTKLGVLIHVEVPFIFPWHGAPYDFYRFTPSGLRLLFPKCALDSLIVSEGNWSAAAVTVANAQVNSFKNRVPRMAAVAFSRLSLWWMQYLDLERSRYRYYMPKGVAVTYCHDGILRDDRTLLREMNEFC